MFLELQTNMKNSQGEQWRVNESILQDNKAIEEIKREIQAYFEINNTEDIPGTTLWEVHKCVIRGILIKLGARKKN